MKLEKVSTLLLQCSVSCGGGWKRRRVICQDETGPTEACDPETRPQEMEECKGEACPVWSYGNWAQVIRLPVFYLGALEILFFFCFSPGFSHHMLSPVWLMIFLLRLLARSQPSTFHVLFFHLVFGRPIFLFPTISILNTFLSMCSSSLLITCPCQFNGHSVIFLEACATLVVPRKCSFLILSLRVSPHSIVAFSSRSPQSVSPVAWL